MAYDTLFSPMNIGTMEVKNRIVMCAAEFSLGQPNGKPTQRMIDYYEERAKGGVGLIIPGICRVNDMGGASTYTQLSMSHDYHIDAMREMSRRIHKHGAKLAIQLHHPGRQGMASAINSLPLVIPISNAVPKVMNGIFKCTPMLLSMEEKGICFSMQAPSKCELAKHGATRIHAMSKREIKKLIQDFIDAAARCKRAGVDAVELHAGHGYLLQQFMSPLTNLRTDEYGGNLSGRMRFITEIICGIKATCGKDYPLIVRLTADEMYDRIGQPGKGYALDTGKEIAKRLEVLGVDAINVTSACYDAYNYWLEPTTFEPGWRKYLAQEIKSIVNIPVIAANVIRTPEQAEAQLKEGAQDFIASARTFICDPHWAEKARTGRSNEIQRCIGCLNCISSFMNNAGIGKPGECSLNMSIAREKAYFDMPKDGAGRKAIVIGAGPAGLKAAQILAMRGFETTVYEKEERAGGQVIAAAACNLHERLYWGIEDLMTNAQKEGAVIHLGTEITPEEILAQKPDVVIMATGGTPIRPGSIPGINRDNVVLATDVILKKTEIKDKRVAVIGSGMTGLETSEMLCENGNQVTIIEMAKELAPGAWFQLVDDALTRITNHNAQILTNTKLTGIDDDGVTVADAATNEPKVIPADYVVLAMGVRPTENFAQELEAAGIRVVTVGDAVKSGTIAHACHSAFDAVMAIV